MKNSGKILFWSGLISGLAALGFTGWGTAKAVKKLEEKDLSFKDIKEEPKEVLKTVYKCYIPAACVTLVSGTCLVCSEIKNEKVQAGLAAAARISETALYEFRDAITEEYGTKAVQKIDDKIATEYAEEFPEEGRVVLQGRGGNVRFYIRPLDIWFYSDMETIKTGINEADAICNSDGEVSINELLYLWGLGSIKSMDDNGWMDDHRGTCVKDAIRFTSKLDADGKASVVINFEFTNFNTRRTY